jgi:hypothetical protein
VNHNHTHDSLADQTAQAVAQRLPQRVKYWVLIQEGAKNIDPGEGLPDVPFTVVLSRMIKTVKAKL